MKRAMCERVCVKYVFYSLFKYEMKSVNKRNEEICVFNVCESSLIMGSGNRAHFFIDLHSFLGAKTLG